MMAITAWDTINREKIDFIVSDWNMPKMTGIELLRKGPFKRTVCWYPISYGYSRSTTGKYYWGGCRPRFQTILVNPSLPIPCETENWQNFPIGHDGGFRGWRNRTANAARRNRLCWRAKKVELDLDDGSFSSDRKKRLLPAPFDEQLPVTPDDGAAGRSRKETEKETPYRYGSVGYPLCLLQLPCGGSFSYSPPPPKAQNRKLLLFQPPAPGAQDNDIVREFATFVVPGKDSHGRTDFLICKICRYHTWSKYTTWDRKAACAIERRHLLLFAQQGQRLYFWCKEWGWKSKGTFIRFQWLSYTGKGWRYCLWKLFESLNSGKGFSMSVDTTMAVLYAQSGLSNMANVAATAPQASLQWAVCLLPNRPDRNGSRWKKVTKAKSPIYKPGSRRQQGFFGK